MILQHGLCMMELAKNVKHLPKVWMKIMADEEKEDMKKGVKAWTTNIIGVILTILIGSGFR